MKNSSCTIFTILLLIFLGGFQTYGQNKTLSSSGTWGKYGQVVDAKGEIELTGDVNMVGVIRINANDTLKIYSTSNRTIKNTGIALEGDKVNGTTVSAGRSRMFTVKSGGKLIIEGRNGATITIDGGANYSWSNYVLTSENGRKLSEAIANEGTLELNNVIITDVFGNNQNGGAILISGGTNIVNGPTTLTNCVIQECYSELGSAIMIGQQRVDGQSEHNDPEKCRVRLEKTTIQHCISGGGPAANSGGAIRTYGNSVSNLEMIEVTMKENYAMKGTHKNSESNDANGGALFWNAHGNEEASVCTINKCHFIGNRSDDNGGAIKSQGSLVFTGSPTTIEENIAPHGGGLYIEGYHGGANNNEGASEISVTLNQNLILYNNYAPEREDNPGTGGGVEFYFGNMDLNEGSTITVNLRGAQIKKNYATSKGGGIFFENNNNEYKIIINLNHGVVDNNTAASGAGIYISNGSITYNESIQVDSTLSVSNNTITDSGNGAGIHINGGSMTLKNGTISNNTITNTGNGAGIHINGGSMTLKNGTISNNTITNTGNGGGIYVKDGGFTMENGSVTNNAGTLGGGVYIDGGDFEMHAGKISQNGEKDNNIVTQDGGGVYLNNGDFSLLGGSISENKAAGNGGGVYLEGADCEYTLSAGSISSNIAGNGGGVYLANGSFVLVEAANGEAAISDDIVASISSNTADTNGGGVYIAGGNFTMNGGEVASNKALNGQGGGVYIAQADNTQTTTTEETYSFTMNGGDIKNNQALGTEGAAEKGEGGGAYLFNGSMLINKGSILSNNASNDGGGIYIIGGGLTLSKGQIKGNYSQRNGGGAFIGGGGSFIMTDGEGKVEENGKQDSNIKTKNGGGIFLDGGTMTINAGSIQNNATTLDGGGIYIIGGGGLTISEGQITANYSQRNGGGAYIGDGGSFMMTHKNGLVSQNGKNNDTIVTENGGGIFLNGGTMNIDAGSIQKNTSIYDGGGVYIMNGNISMTDGFIEGNISNRYGGGVYVYNESTTEETRKQVELSGGTISKNEALYGGGICVDGHIKLSVENIQIASNEAINGGGICLMNSADMDFISGQIISNKAIGTSALSETTAYQKDITQVNGIGGGVYLNSNTQLIFMESDNLGLYGNTATNGADELFANGSDTSINIPDVGGMTLDESIPGAGNLKWIKDYIITDTSYDKGPELSTDGSAQDNWSGRNIRYRDMVSQNIQDMPQLKGGISADDDRSETYMCFALGYEVIFLTLERHDLQTGESAIFTVEKLVSDSDGDPTEDVVDGSTFQVILTGTTENSGIARTDIAVTAGWWRITETDWSWTYNVLDSADAELEDKQIKMDVTDEDTRTFTFKASKKAGLPLYHETTVIKVLE